MGSTTIWALLHSNLDKLLRHCVSVSKWYYEVMLPCSSKGDLVDNTGSCRRHSQAVCLKTMIGFSPYILTNHVTMGLPLPLPYCMCLCFSVVFGEQMLKKAQRDMGNTVRKTISSLSQVVEDELSAAFRTFSTAVMCKEADVCAVRAEYLQMDQRQLFNFVFTKLRQLYQIIDNVQISWEGSAAYGSGHARRKALHRSLSIVNNFAGHLTTDTLMQKMFKVVIVLY